MLPFLSALPPDRPDWSYADRFEEYIDALKHTVTSDVIEKLSSSSKSLELPLKKFLFEVESFAERLLDEYRRTFERREGGTFKYGEAEVQLVRAIDDGLWWAHRVASAIREGELTPRLTQQALRGIEEATQQLDTFGHNRGPGLRDLQLIAPTTTGKLHLGASALVDHVGRGKKFLEMCDRVNERHFLRPDKASVGVRFSGWDASQREKGAVYVNVLNHDYGFFDLVIAARRCWPKEDPIPYVMSRASAQPSYALRRTREKEMIFIEDRKPLDLMRKRLAQHPAEDTLHVFVAPEGVVPRFFAQFPLTVKAGAFVLAHRLANEFDGTRKVFLVQHTSNALEHLSGRKSTHLHVHTQEPALVPPKDPAWIEEARQGFAALVDEQRGQRIVDLSEPGFIPGSSVPYSDFRGAP